MEKLSQEIEKILILFVEPVPAVIEAEFWVGNFQEINWKFAKLLADFLGQTLQKIYQDLNAIVNGVHQRQEKCIQPGLVIDLRSSIASFDQLDSIVELILKSITEENINQSEDLFSCYSEINDVIKTIISDQCTSFLREHPKMKISTPLEVCVKSKKFIFTGRLGAPTYIESPYLPNLFFIGVVDVLARSTSMVTILTESGSVSAHFDKNTFYEKLHSELGEPQQKPIQVELKQVFDSKNSLTRTVLKIDPL